MRINLQKEFSLILKIAYAVNKKQKYLYLNQCHVDTYQTKRQ